MSILSDCCYPCPTVPAVNVPGSPGADGTNGSNGINAFSIVDTAGFTVPSANSPVSVPITDTGAWMVVGQPVFVQTAGYYQVNSAASSNTVSLTNLGLPGNALQGTGILANAQISPAGSAGYNSYTTSAATFTIPGSGSTATLTVNNVAWMNVGQIIYITNAGYYQVNSTDTTANTALVLNLGYVGNPTSGTVGSGAGVSPGGLQGSITPVVPQVAYSASLSQALTASMATVIPIYVVLPAAGTWLLMGRLAELITVTNTNNASQVSAQLEYQVSGVGAFTQIATSVTSPYTPSNAAGSGAGFSFTLPPVIYSTATTGDVIYLYADYITKQSNVTAITINEGCLVATYLNATT